MYITDLPFRGYFDLAGAPLDSGYLYFGQPNQNPETAPITVYWDAAGTQPALQPIRTTNGLIVYNGAIANLFVAGNYSMTVRDRNKSLVFYASTSDRIPFQASLAATGGAALIGWIQSGAGAVARLAQDKLRERVSVQDFGAVGDGVTDDSAAFTAALATGKRVLVPYTSTGYNLGATVFTIANSNFIDGEDMVTLKSAAATSLFKMTGNGSSSGISNFTIDMNTAPAGSSAIRYATASAACSRSTLKNLAFKNCYEAIGEDNAGTYIFEHVWEDIKCTLPKGRQIFSKNSRGFIYLNRVNVDCTLSATPVVTWESIVFNNYIGLYLRDVTVTGQNVAQLVSPGYQAGAIGIKFQGTKPSGGHRFIWMDDVRVESSCGPGIQILDSAFVAGDNVEAFGCLGLPIYVENVDLIQGSKWAGRGANDLTGGLAASNGLSFVTCTKVNINGIRSGQNTGNGVFVNNSSSVTLSDVYTENNTSAGLIETGTSNGNTFSNLVSNSNATVSAITGSRSAILGYVIDGVRQPSTPVVSFWAHKNSTDQLGVVPTTFTKVTYGTTGMEKGGHYDTTLSRWTPPAGNYRISASAIVTANIVTGGEMSILIYKNGAAYMIETSEGGTLASKTLSINRPVTANGTDYFEIFVYLAGGSNKTIGGALSQSEFMGSPF